MRCAGPPPSHTAVPAAGGYENLAFYTNSDGEVDFEAAYESQMIDLDFGYELDPLDRAILYHTDKEMQRQHNKKSKTRT